MNKKDLTIWVLFLALVAIILAGVLWCVNNRLEEIDKAGDVEVVIPENGEVSDLSPKLDLTNWRIYRNEKYNFQLELPDEYLLPGNSKNINIEEVPSDGILYLKSDMNVYSFSSRSGAKIIEKYYEPGIPGPHDYWEVIISIYPVDLAYLSDFEMWLDKNNFAGVQEMGFISLENEKAVRYVDWVSMAETASVFMVNDKVIVEINIMGSSYIYDKKKDYFSKIINTFRFIEN